MHPTNCLNCGTLLTADDNFCPVCGQKSNTHRITLSHTFHEFFHSLTHADKGIFALLRDLALRPGKVAAEYIKGRRKKYFSPFTFFLLCAGLILITNRVFKSFAQEQNPDPRVIAQLPTESQRKSYIALFERINEASAFVRNHSNVISMIALPFYAFVSWIFFMRRGYNYAEFLVANMMFLGFANLLLSLLILTWIGKFAGQSLYFYGIGAGQFLLVTYLAWAQFQFLGYKNKSAMLMTWGVCFLAILLWAIITTLFMFYYVFRSYTGLVLKATWQKLMGN